MAWQNTFNSIFGPGLYAGIKAGDLFGLLRDNRFAVGPRHVLRCLSAAGRELIGEGLTVGCPASLAAS